MLTPSFAMGGIQAAIQHSTTNRYFSVYEPFSHELWICIIFLWLFYGLSLRFISILSKRMINASLIQEEEQFSLCRSLWYFTFVPLQFGTDKHPKSLSGNILQSSWAFFTIIAVAAYTANLAAFFSATIIHRQLDSIDEILKSDRNLFSSVISKVEIQGLGHEILNHLIEQNRIEFFESNLTQEVPDESKLYSENYHKVMKEKVKDRLTLGNIWIHIDSESLTYGLDDLYKLDGYFASSGYGFALRKDWILAEKVKDRFIHYGSSGTLDKFTRKYRKANVRDIPVSVSRSFEVKGFLPVILIMLALGVIADLLMIAAYLWQKMKKNTIEVQK